MTKKEQILKLVSEGKSFTQIVKMVGCSKSTVSYHLNPSVRQKSRNRQRKYRNTIKGAFDHKLGSKITNFNYTALYEKARTYRIKSKDVYKKLLEQDMKCYITGLPLDITDTNSWHLDHIVPTSKGGDNSYDNLGICTRTSNLSKSDMTIDEYINHCKLVLKHLKKSL